MSGKFIRFNADGSIAEIVTINEDTKPECLKKLRKMFHPDLVKEFEYHPGEKVAKVGQVKSGNKFIDKPKLERSNLSVKREAKSKIAHIERKAMGELLEFVVTLPNCPDKLKDFHAQIEDEKVKL